MAARGLSWHGNPEAPDTSTALLVPLLRLPSSVRLSLPPVCVIKASPPDVAVPCTFRENQRNTLCCRTYAPLTKKTFGRNRSNVVSRCEKLRRFVYKINNLETSAAKSESIELGV